MRRNALLYFKPFTPLLFSLYLVFNSLQIVAQNERSKAGWIGNVKSYTLTQHMAYPEDGRIKSGGYVLGSQAVRVTYSPDGNLTEHLTYDPETKVIQYKTIYQYNTKGLKTASWREDANGNISQKRTYQYNHADQLVEETYAAWEIKTIYTYNDSGLLASETHYHLTEGTAKSKEFYCYDPYGNVIDWIYAAPDGSIGSRISYIYTYTRDRKVLQKVNFDTDVMTEVSKYTYIYDDFGNLAEEKLFVEADAQIKRHIKYHSNGQIKEQTEWLSTGKTVSTYDEKGNITVLKTYGKANGKLTVVRQFSYVFDTHGNWIKKASSSYYPDTPSQRFNYTYELREIEYYL